LLRVHTMQHALVRRRHGTGPPAVLDKCSSEGDSGTVV
jgi:hypothetical protein